MSNDNGKEILDESLVYKKIKQRKKNSQMWNDMITSAFYLIELKMTTFKH